MKKKTYNPPPKPHTPTMPKKFTSYLLLNPAFPVELVYQILSNSAKNTEPLMMIKGTAKDFEDNPNVMFRKIDQEINIK